MKRVLFVFVAGMVVFMAASASAVTKLQAEYVLKVELTHYFADEPTTLTRQELRDLLLFYTAMDAQRDIDVNATTLSATIKALFEIATAPAPNGSIPAAPLEEGLLNGRDSGVYCGDAGDYICKTRYCSPVWNLCAPNPKPMDELAEAGEECRAGYECTTGVCRYGACVAKVCELNEQCTSNNCIRQYWWRSSRSFCDEPGY